MRKSLPVLAASCALSITAWAGDKPVEVSAGSAIPAKIIATSHLGPLKQDLPAVLPMVVVSFQTQATEKGGSGPLGSGIFSSGALQYTLEGITPALMQKIADETQEAIEAELQAVGWQVLPAEKATETEAYKAWSKAPDASGVEVKREFFSQGKGTNTFSSKEMERVFVAGKRPLVGNGVVLGGWTAAPSLCLIGKEVGAKVVLFRAIVNFATISAGKKGLFTGSQQWKSSSTLDVSYAEMDVYPPDSSGATPSRLNTDTPITLHSDFVKDVQKSGSHMTIVADPERYEKDTVEALRAVAKGFAAESKK
jgi:hypothetical protein